VEVAGQEKMADLLQQKGNRDPVKLFKKPSSKEANTKTIDVQKKGTITRAVLPGA